jgi:spore coat protein H
MTSRFTKICCISMILLFICAFYPEAAVSKSLSDRPSEELFGITKLWTIQLKVSAEQWAKIEPENSGGFPGEPPRVNRPPMNDEQNRPNRPDQNMNAPAVTEGQRPNRRARGMRGPGRGMGGTNFPYVQADYVFEGQTIKKVGLRYKGQSTFMMARNSPKKSFKVDFNRFSKNQKFFGIKKLNLNNNMMTPSHMIDTLAYEMFRDFQISAPRTALAKVYLNVEGRKEPEYLGLYTLIEQVDDYFIKQNFDQNKGLLLKPQHIQSFPYLGDNWDDYEKPYEPKSDDVTWKEAKRFMAFTKFVNQSSDEEFEAQIEGYTDVVQFLRFLAVNVVIGNYDGILSMGQNFYIYGDPDSQKYLWIPWDLNLSFGKFPMVGSYIQQMQANIDQPAAADQILIERILAIPQWKERYLGYIREFNKTVFQPERIREKIDAINKVIQDTVKDEPNSKFEQYIKAISDEPIDITKDIENPFSRGNRPGRDENRERRRDGRREGRPDVERGPGGRGPGGIRTSFSIVSWIKGRRLSIQQQFDEESEGVKLTRGGPGGRGGSGGGPGGFGPGMFLGPQLFDQLDIDKDDKITQTEWDNKTILWSTEWDKDDNKILTEKEIADGLGQIFRLPEDLPFGPPGDFSPGMLLVEPFMEKADDDGNLNQNDCKTLWKDWFKKWDADQSNDLNKDEMTQGINQNARPPRGFMGGPPGF